MPEPLLVTVGLAATDNPVVDWPVAVVPERLIDWPVRVPVKVTAEDSVNNVPVVKAGLIVKFEAEVKLFELVK